MPEDSVTNSKIAEILDLLIDGEWHELEETRATSGIQQTQFLKVVEFLKEYGFIVMDETGAKIKLDKTAQVFLTQTAIS